MARKTLAVFADSYPYLPIKGAIGDAVVAFPYFGHAPGFWLLSDYRVSSVASGTVWLLLRDAPAPAF